MNYLIKNYIDKISTDDIIKFGNDNDIVISDDEAYYLKNIVQNNYDDLVCGNENVLNNVMDKFGVQRGQKIKDLFFIYKEKYKDYL